MHDLKNTFPKDSAELKELENLASHIVTAYDDYGALRNKIQRKAPNGIVPPELENIGYAIFLTNEMLYALMIRISRTADNEARTY